MTVETLTNRQAKTNATSQPKLIYVRYGDGVTSALVLKETPHGWLAQRRFKDVRGNVYLEQPERSWKRALGCWVWEDLAEAKTDTTTHLVLQLETRRKEIADLREALTLIAEYQPAEVS